MGVGIVLPEVQAASSRFAPITGSTVYAPSTSDPKLRIGGGTWIHDPDVSMTATATFGTGVLVLNGFRCARTESVKGVLVFSGTTAAGATPTLIRYGLYEQQTDLSWTRVAATVSDTSLLAASNTKYEKDFAAPYTITAGKEYMLGGLVVTGAAFPHHVGPAISGSSNGFQNEVNTNGPARRVGLSGQTDLPATIANATVTTTPTNLAFHAALTPNF